jgi:hypothetical protein
VLGSSNRTMMPFLQSRQVISLAKWFIHGKHEPRRRTVPTLLWTRSCEDARTVCYSHLAPVSAVKAADTHREHGQEKNPLDTVWALEQVVSQIKTSRDF